MCTCFDHQIHVCIHGRFGCMYVGRLVTWICMSMYVGTVVHKYLYQLQHVGMYNPNLKSISAATDLADFSSFVLPIPPLPVKATIPKSFNLPSLMATNCSFKTLISLSRPISESCS